MGRDVATDGDLLVRLVADSCRGETLGSVGRDARSSGAPERRSVGDEQAGSCRATTMTHLRRWACVAGRLQSRYNRFFPLADHHRPVDSFRDRIAAFAREIDDVARGDEDALHRARVASRRLRELLPLLELDGETSRKLTRQL